MANIGVAFQSPQVLSANAQSVAVIQGSDMSISTTTYWLTGTFTLTVTWQCSYDGTNWTSLLMVPLATGTASVTATVPGGYRCDSSGIPFMRATTTAFTSGSATVTAVVVTSP